MTVFSGVCSGCGGRLSTDTVAERDNTDGVHVRCSECGDTNFLRPDTAGGYRPACSWFIPMFRQNREVDA